MGVWAHSGWSMGATECGGGNGASVTNAPVVRPTSLMLLKGHPAAEPDHDSLQGPKQHLNGSSASLMRGEELCQARSISRGAYA